MVTLGCISSIGQSHSAKISANQKLDFRGISEIRRSFLGLFLVFSFILLNKKENGYIDFLHTLLHLI